MKTATVWLAVKTATVCLAVKTAMLGGGENRYSMVGDSMVGCDNRYVGWR